MLCKNYFLVFKLFSFQALVTKVKDAADKGLDHITISEVNGDQKFLLKVNKLIK